MEIGSMDSMAGMMGMQGMQGMMGGNQPPPPKGEAGDMSSTFMDAMDTDGDSQLSKTEFTSGGTSDSSEVFDILDTNEDGFVSQDELEADKESKMGSAKQQMQAQMQASAFGGLQQNGDTEQFQQLLNLVGKGTESQSSGAEQYGKMQENGLGKYGEQALSAGLSVSA